MSLDIALKPRARPVRGPGDESFEKQKGSRVHPAVDSKNGRPPESRDSRADEPTSIIVEGDRRPRRTRLKYVSVEGKHVCLWRVVVAGYFTAFCYAVRCKIS